MNNICPVTKELCMGDQCAWFKKSATSVGNKHLGCVVWHLLERLDSIEMHQTE